MNAKLFLTAWLAIGTATLTQGELLVYKIAQTSRIVGQSTEKRISASGRFVWDWDTGEMQTLTYYTLNGSKQYARKVMDQVHYFYAKAPRGKTYAARPSIEINGVTMATSEDWHGCSFETGPGLTNTRTYPSGTKLTLKTTAGYLKTGSQIFIWKDGASQLLYDNSQDTKRDSSVTRTIP